MNHLRYALRTLLKSPGFAIAAIVCLALGIGANTAIFTVVNAVLFRPLAYKDSERLVRLYTEFPTYGSSGGFRKFWMSTPELLELRRDTTAWEALESYTITGVNLGGGSDPVRVTAANLTGGMLPMLGVAPQKGRLLGADDDRFGAPLAVIISDGLWRRAFGGDSNVTGREVKINGLTGERGGRHAAGICVSPGRTGSAGNLVSATDQSRESGRPGVALSVRNREAEARLFDRAGAERNRADRDTGGPR